MTEGRGGPRGVVERFAIDMVVDLCLLMYVGDKMDREMLELSLSCERECSTHGAVGARCKSSRQRHTMNC